MFTESDGVADLFCLQPMEADEDAPRIRQYISALGRSGGHQKLVLKGDGPPKKGAGSGGGGVAGVGESSRERNVVAASKCDEVPKFRVRACVPGQKHSTRQRRITSSLPNRRASMCASSHSYHSA